MQVGYYCGSLVYADLHYRQNTKQMDGDQSIESAKETFQKCANHLYEKAVDTGNNEHDLFIELALFFAL